MSSLDRRPGRVIFTRPGQTPGLHDGIYQLALLATGLCSALMLVVEEPFVGAMAATLCGVVAMAMGLMVMSSRVARGGRLLQVRKRFELVSPTAAEGYRDAPNEDELEFDGHRFPKSKVREVVLGHFFTGSGGGAQHDFWPVYLVLDDRVVELATLRDKSSALKLRREIAELFDVPMCERETGIFGVGVSAGCLNGLVTISLDMIFIALPVFVITTLGEFAAIPIPALMALLLWLNHRLTPTLFARGVREGIDEQVARTFELGAARARVEDDEADEEAEAKPNANANANEAEA